MKKTVKTPQPKPKVTAEGSKVTLKNNTVRTTGGGTGSGDGPPARKFK